MDVTLWHLCPFSSSLQSASRTESVHYVHLLQATADQPREGPQKMKKDALVMHMKNILFVMILTQKSEVPA